MRPPKKPKEQPATGNLYLRWRFAEAPPVGLDRPLTTAEALAGIARAEAWCAWARQEVQAAQDSDAMEVIGTTVARIGAAIEGMHTDEHAHAAVDARNIVIDFAMGAADSVVSSDHPDGEAVAIDVAVGMTIDRARDVAPVLAERLEEQLPVVRAALAALRRPTKREPVADLVDVLEGRAPQKRGTPDAAWRAFKRWRETRRKRRRKQGSNE